MVLTEPLTLSISVNTIGYFYRRTQGGGGGFQASTTALKKVIQRYALCTYT